MSVRKNDRSLSKMEYIHNAQQIVFLATDRIRKYVNKVDKNVRFKHLASSTNYYVWNTPIFHAQRAYECVQSANGERDTNKRLALLDKANENLVLLESSLETFYKTFRMVIKDKFIELITEKIDFERRLIKGVQEQTRNAICKTVPQ